MKENLIAYLHKKTQSVISETCRIAESRPVCLDPSANRCNLNNICTSSTEIFQLVPGKAKLITKFISCHIERLELRMSLFLVYANICGCILYQLWPNLLQHLQPKMVYRKESMMQLTYCSGKLSYPDEIVLLLQFIMVSMLQ